MSVRGGIMVSNKTMLIDLTPKTAFMLDDAIKRCVTDKLSLSIYTSNRKYSHKIKRLFIDTCLKYGVETYLDCQNDKVLLSKNLF